MRILNHSILLACLAGGLLCTSSAFAQNRAPDYQTTQRPQVLVDPGRIYNEQPMSWVGKSVILQNVTVQDTNDSGNFWVGSDSDHRLLVVKEGDDATLRAMRFHKGDIVTINGTVQAASRYMARVNDAGKGSMHDAQKTSGVILLANNVTVSSSTHR